MKRGTVTVSKLAKFERASDYLSARRSGELKIVPVGLHEGQPVLAAVSEAQFERSAVALGSLDYYAAVLVLADLQALFVANYAPRLLTAEAPDSVIPSPRAFNLLSYSQANALRAIPIGFDGDRLLVAIASVFDLPLVEAAVKLPVSGVVYAPDVISGWIGKSYVRGVTLPGDLGGNEPHKFLDACLDELLRRGGQDLHADCGEDGRGRVRLSIDGHLLRPLSVAQEVPNDFIHTFGRALLTLGGALGSHEFSSQLHDAYVTRTVDGRAVECRIAIAPSLHGATITVRVTQGEQTIRPLDALGMPPWVYEQVKIVLEYPDGGTAMCGPVGSGKSWSIRACLLHLFLRYPDLCIRSVENPVEQQLRFVLQTSFDKRSNVSIAQLIEQFLRMNTDVFFIGEGRDRATIAAIIEASLFGHRVFTTFHSASGPIAIQRLINRGIERDDIAEGFNAFVGQRLADRICPGCSTLVPLAPSIREAIAKAFPTIEATKLITAATPRVPSDIGCERCERGYSGRVGIFEIFTLTQEVRDALVQGASVRDLIPLDPTYRPMYVHGLQLIAQGLTTIEAIRRVTRVPLGRKQEEDSAA